MGRNAKSSKYTRTSFGLVAPVQCSVVQTMANCNSVFLMFVLTWCLCQTFYLCVDSIQWRCNTSSLRLLHLLRTAADCSIAFYIFSINVLRCVCNVLFLFVWTSVHLLWSEFNINASILPLNAIQRLPLMQLCNTI